MKLLTLGAAVLFVIGVLFLYVWYRMHTKLNLHSENSREVLPAGFKAKTQFVINKDKQKIAYWYFPVENPKAIVILIHPYSVPGGKPQMLRLAKYIHEGGYSTVLLDLRSFGESEGNKITLGINEWKDVEAVFDKIKSLHENKDKKIGFLGVSMGAATAIITAGKTGKGDFVITSVPYANFQSLFDSQIKASGLPPIIFYPFMKPSAIIELGKNYEQFSPSKIIQNIKVPIFLISANQDEEINSQDGQNLYKLANQPKTYWEVDSHHDIFGEHPQEFKDKVLSFLEKFD